MNHFERIFQYAAPAFSQERTWKRGRNLALSSLVCLGKRTITGMLTASGRQFVDWSADYRLFNRERFDPQRLFDVLRQEVLRQLPKHAPLVVAMDDSLFRKTGKKTAGVAYRRDPLGPPFHVNFVRGQRFLQISAALPLKEQPGPAMMIPIDFRHCPTPKKPQKNAPKQQWQKYRLLQNQLNISRVGVERLNTLRKKLDGTPQGKQRLLVAAVDGSYTNGTVLKKLQPRIILIGRIRKDAKLYFLPKPSTKHSPGRKRVYGDQAPTPEELRKDTQIPYQRITAWAVGKTHRFKIKTLPALRWRTAGGNHNLRLVVIAPLAYRLSKNSPLLYRQPAYLICTDPDLPLEDLLQMYLRRWGIEVNFRDEKHILGAGQAQVRKAQAVENVPALIIAAYGMLLLAAVKACALRNNMDLALPKPKWRQNQNDKIASTQQLINRLRAELWGEFLGINNFSGFVTKGKTYDKLKKIRPNLASAVLYANN